MGNEGKNEYQFLHLSEEPSDAQAKSAEEGTSELFAEVLDGDVKQEPAEPEIQVEFAETAEPAESSAEPPLTELEPEPAKTEQPLPEEPDLEQLAQQIREETERDRKRRVRANPQKQPEQPKDTAAEEAAEPQQKPQEPDEQPAMKRIRGLFEYVETFCVALAVMIILFLYVFRYVSVDGDSMLPTLHGGDSSDHADRLIISDFLYEPKTGDIVVLNTGTSERPLIKRVIAAGGQTVRINFSTWDVMVDGVLLDEDYIFYREGQTMEFRDMGWMYGIDENGVCEFTVGEGKVFVMGDNRNNSKDSRFYEIGEQDVEHILGKVILRLYPFGEFGTV